MLQIALPAERLIADAVWVVVDPDDGFTDMEVPVNETAIKFCLSSAGTHRRHLFCRISQLKHTTTAFK